MLLATINASRLISKSNEVIMTCMLLILVQILFFFLDVIVLHFDSDDIVTRWRREH